MFKLASRFFDNVIKNNEIHFEKHSKKPLDGNLMNRHKVLLPDWLSPHALTLFIKYLYLGHLTPSSSNTPAPSFEVLFDLLMLSHYFKHPVLPLQLVFEALLPSMSLKWSLFTLKNLE